MYGLVLAQGDSLLLSVSQTTTLRALETPYLQRMDSLWRALGESLAALPETYGGASTQARADAASDAVWELAQAESRRIATVLSAVQLSLAPRLVRGLAASAVRTGAQWRLLDRQHTPAGRREAVRILRSGTVS